MELDVGRWCTRYSIRSIRPTGRGNPAPERRSAGPRIRWVRHGRCALYAAATADTAADAGRAAATNPRTRCSRCATGGYSAPRPAQCAARFHGAHGAYTHGDAVGFPAIQFHAPVFYLYQSSFSAAGSSRLAIAVVVRTGSGSGL